MYRVNIISLRSIFVAKKVDVYSELIALFFLHIRINEFFSFALHIFLHGPQLEAKFTNLARLSSFNKESLYIGFRWKRCEPMLFYTPRFFGGNV